MLMVIGSSRNVTNFGLSLFGIQTGNRKNQIVCSEMVSFRAYNIPTSSSAPSSRSAGANQRYIAIGIPVPSLKRPLLVVLWEFFCDFISEKSGAILNCYIAEHISHEWELRFLETKSFEESPAVDSTLGQ